MTILGFAIIGTYYLSFSGTQKIVINEVAGDYAIFTEDGENTVNDYIELYNTGNLNCVLYELYLSDDSGNLKKLPIPTYTIPANPNNGYRFVGWEGDISGTESTIEISLNEGGTQLYAVFEKIDTP